MGRTGCARRDGMSREGRTLPTSAPGRRHAAGVQPPSGKRGSGFLWEVRVADPPPKPRADLPDDFYLVVYPY